MPSPDPGRSLWLNETTIRFDEQGNMLALARSDRKRTNAFFGISRPPYKEWSGPTPATSFTDPTSSA